ncbi:XRE family transcriptional regulator [Marinicauda algicola]|uniref:XRE family transcriptional regulator n=1 Tax=Marinicauda algicola TaxID=2029849 RepID=A0A4S2GX34_9PROT|nr:helix-turn-helix transcriptional regulator [Marinicauda algicola]TGY87448.1 XRE family transcriptional regulator [Marinicauda algicola]
MTEWTDATHWGLALKKLRQRQNLKQEAVAALLGLSQAYISRLEQGGLQPTPEVVARLRALLEEPANRPIFDDWRNGVAVSEQISSLIHLRAGAVRLVEFSNGFRAFGGAFATIKTGMPLNGAIGEDADHQFDRLEQLGLFDGAVASAESIWSTSQGGVERFLRSRSVPVRDDFGAWHVFSTHRLIDQDEYRARRQAGSEVLLLRTGEIEFHDDGRGAQRPLTAPPPTAPMLPARELRAPEPGSGFMP